MARFRKIILALFSICVLSAWTHGNNAVYVNLSFFDAAACTGIEHDDSPAFISGFNAAYQNSAVPVVLNLPTNGQCYPNSTLPSPCGAGQEPCLEPARKIPNLTVNMNGATLNDGPGGRAFGLGQGVGQIDAPGFSALFHTVSAGTNCITLIVAAQVSKFPVGSPVELTGIDLQGSGSFPTNPGIFEYPGNVISRNAGTGVVCFQNTLINSYREDWPSYAPEGVALSQGGPATIYAFDQAWNSTVVWNGPGTINTSTETDGFAKNFTTNNVTIVGTGQLGFFPTLEGSAAINNLTALNSSEEVDKSNALVIYDHSTIHGLTIQSSSTNIVIRNGSNITNEMSGTPQSFVCNASTIASLTFGPSGYGAAQTASSTNCLLPSISWRGVHADAIVNSGWSQSGQVLSRAHSNGPVPWAIPGRTYYLLGQYDYEYGPITLVSMTDDGTNTFLTFSNFPSSTLLATLPTTAGNLYINPDPAPVWNGVGNSGGPTAVDLNNTCAQGAKLWTCSVRTYTCTNNVANVSGSIDINNIPADLNGAQGPEIWGAVSAVNVNVTTADTSATGTVAIHLGNTFDNYTVIKSNGATETWGPVINLKTTGARIYTGTANSWSGLKTGDTLPTLSGVSETMTGAMPPSATNITAETAGQCPVVTVTLQTSR